MTEHSTHNFTDTIRDRLSIVDVVSRYVPITKRGASYWCCCPFHSEKTPSMCVNEKRGQFHCFGCGEHGDIFSFVMKFLHCDFITATKELANLAGVEIPRQKSVSDRSLCVRKSKYFDLYERATREYERLLNSRSGEVALAYLHDRGFTSEMIKKFRIGYAPNANTLSDLFIGESSSALYGSGLVRQGGVGPYDFFRDRIMFPITDERGRVIAFSARAIFGDGPKYVNSADTEFFHKRQTLYGLHTAKNSIYLNNRIIVVEGQIDCIKMQCAGLQEAVAPLGSAFTTDHLRTISKMNRNIIFLFDGDEAGKKAAFNACKLCLPFVRYDSDIRVAFLPFQEDPDSLLESQGLDGMMPILDNSVPLFEFLWDKLTEMWNTKEIMGRANFLKAMRAVCVAIEDEELRKDITLEYTARTLKRFYSKTDRIALARRLGDVC